MSPTERTYELVALQDPEGQWEVHRGRLREEAGMTAAHNQLGVDLAVALVRGLDRTAFTVRIDSARAKRSDETYYIPDVFVVPTRLVAAQIGGTDRLEIYEDPLPFVAEIWSRSTGGYDVDAKIPEYMRRGDREIWRINPYERAVTAQRRQPDGVYSESAHRTGPLTLHAIPTVTIDLDDLFAQVSKRVELPRCHPQSAGGNGWFVGGAVANEQADCRGPDYPRSRWER